MPGEPPADGPDLRAAARAGMRRAGYHMIKAGWEVLAGVGAFLEELRKAGAEPEDNAQGRPQRITLEPDDEE